MAENLTRKATQSMHQPAIQIYIWSCMTLNFDLLTPKVHHFMPLLHGPLKSVQCSFSKYRVQIFGSRWTNPQMNKWTDWLHYVEMQSSACQAGLVENTMPLPARMVSLRTLCLCLLGWSGWLHYAELRLPGSSGKGKKQMREIWKHTGIVGTRSSLSMPSWSAESTSNGISMDGIHCCSPVMLDCCCCCCMCDAPVVLCTEQTVYNIVVTTYQLFILRVYFSTRA